MMTAVATMITMGCFRQETRRTEMRGACVRAWPKPWRGLEGGQKLAAKARSIFVMARQAGTLRRFPSKTHWLQIKPVIAAIGMGLVLAGPPQAWAKTLYDKPVYYPESGQLLLELVKVTPGYSVRGERFSLRRSIGTDARRPWRPRFPNRHKGIRGAASSADALRSRGARRAWPDYMRRTRTGHAPLPPRPYVIRRACSLFDRDRPPLLNN